MDARRAEIPARHSHASTPPGFAECHRSTDERRAAKNRAAARAGRAACAPRAALSRRPGFHQRIGNRQPIGRGIPAPRRKLRALGQPDAADSRPPARRRTGKENEDTSMRTSSLLKHLSTAGAMVAALVLLHRTADAAPVNTNEIVVAPAKGELAPPGISSQRSG